MLTMNHFRRRSPDKIFLTDRQTGGQTARQTDAQTDGQTDSYTHARYIVPILESVLVTMLIMVHHTRCDTTNVVPTQITL